MSLNAKSPKTARRATTWAVTLSSNAFGHGRKLTAAKSCTSCDAWAPPAIGAASALPSTPDFRARSTRVFVELYRDGLIYRGRRLINWCPRCETALSDLEVEHKDAQGHLWHIHYPLVDGSGSITVATTRPETMLGDTAVAVHPADERYASLVGKNLRLPLIGREIPIVADESVDREFGTGAVKITPAHDFNDFELGRRHNLPQISVMDTHARMNAKAGPYQGLTREQCRKQIVADLEAQELLEEVDPHAHSVGVCSRCDTVVEPMLSEQWFVAVNKPAPTASRCRARDRGGRAGRHHLPSEILGKHLLFAGCDNIQDWCISRQLWWGHRIPAYWCARCEDPIRSSPRSVRRPARNAAAPICVQDEDVLDTWFSSGLWPFSTLGWPDATPDLKRYYPTSLLLTGFDIIFFWVARMMMFGIYCIDDRADETACRSARFTSRRWSAISTARR